MCSKMASTDFCEYFPAGMTMKSRSPMVSLPRRSEPAGVTEAICLPDRLNVRGDLLGRGFGGVDAEPARGLFEEFDRAQNILFGFFAEAGNVAQFLLARQFGNVFHGPGFEILPEKCGLLGAEALQRQNVEQGWRIFFQQLLAQAVIAGLQDFVDVLGHIVADAGKLGEFFAILREFLDAFVEAVDQLGGFFVAAVAPDDRAVNFEQLRRLVQYPRNLPIFHGVIIEANGRGWELGSRRATG